LTPGVSSFFIQVCNIEKLTISFQELPKISQIYSRKKKKKIPKNLGQNLTVFVGKEIPCF
jgi:hypothetical protein